jgi:hypothetical protein
MNPTFYLFLALSAFYYVIAQQLKVMQRTLTSIEDRLKSLHKLEDAREEQATGRLEDALNALRRDIRKDLKDEIEMHEVRTSD